MKPCCLIEELPSYVWTKSRDGRPVRERPDPTCSDHGVDALRYAAMFLWNRDMSLPEAPPEYEDGTWGDLLGHTALHEYEMGLGDDLN